MEAASTDQQSLSDNSKKWLYETQENFHPRRLLPYSSSHLACVSDEHEARDRQGLSAYIQPPDPAIVCISRLDLCASILLMEESRQVQTARLGRRHIPDASDEDLVKSPHCCPKL